MREVRLLATILLVGAVTGCTTTSITIQADDRSPIVTIVDVGTPTRDTEAEESADEQSQSDEPQIVQHSPDPVTIEPENESGAETDVGSQVALIQPPPALLTDNDALTDLSGLSEQSEDSSVQTESTGGLTDMQQRIIQAADEILRTQNFVVNGHQYPYDCSGTILAIYARAGLRLIDLFPHYSGNGVSRLYGIAEDRELLYDTEWPQPGELIFWDNTYDKNGDKQWNDFLTHVGLVLDVMEDGTIEYLHHDYTKGVVRARMNLTNPTTYMTDDGIIVNSPMRMRSHRYLNPDEWLASHLYRVIGAMHEVDL